MALLGRQRSEYARDGLLSPAERKRARHQGRTRGGLLGNFGANDVAEIVMGALPGSGDVMAARDSVRYGRAMLDSIAAGDYGKAGSDGLQAITAGLGALPLVPYFAGMFAGKRALNAPLDALKTAKKMEASGDNADDIWKATGWGRGADNQWRWEIDDSDYAETLWPTIDVDPFIADEGLSETPYFNHRKAISAYPDLDENLSVAFGGDKIGGMVDRDSASYANDVIDLGSNTSPGVFLHELQHAIQKREKFAPGGSSEYQDEAYRRLAGEVEARNVQKRMFMSPDERRATPPWATEDVPRDKQIIRWLLGRS